LCRVVEGAGTFALLVVEIQVQKVVRQ
jgi:hypothetical protein